MTTNNAINNPGNSFLVPANNLSDLSNKATSLVNLGAFAIVNIQTFSASGTYTPTTNMIYCVVHAIGAGGAGGGASAIAGQLAAGSGGAAGCLSILFASAATIGASQTVTIGTGGTGVSNAPGNAGGNTSLGSLCIGTGGPGGPVGLSVAGSNTILGSTAGAAGTGTITGQGQAGGAAFVLTGVGAQGISGNGGSTFLGSGGFGRNTQGVGSAGITIGGGGAGSLSYNGGGAVAGGAGANGYLYIIEYIS